MTHTQTTSVTLHGAPVQHSRVLYTCGRLAGTSPGNPARRYGHAWLTPHSAMRGEIAGHIGLYPRVLGPLEQVVGFQIFPTLRGATWCGPLDALLRMFPQLCYPDDRDPLSVSATNLTTAKLDLLPAWVSERAALLELTREHKDLVIPDAGFWIRESGRPFVFAFGAPGAEGVPEPVDVRPA